MSGDDFEVLPVGEMRAKFSLTAQNRSTMTLDAVNVPSALCHLIPLAERFGVSDDLIREVILAQTPAHDLDASRQAVRANEGASMHGSPVPRLTGQVSLTNTSHSPA